MSRTRIAAAAAVAVVAGVLWWLLGTGGEAPPGPETSRAASSRQPPAADAEEEYEVRAGPAAPLTPAAVTGAAPADPGREPREEPPKPDHTVRCTAVLEDGTPLPGVESQLEGIWPRASTWYVAFHPEFEISWPEGPAVFAHPHADLVAVEGGVLFPDEGDRRFRVRVESNRLRLVFRDRPGTAHVRLVDAATGEPVEDVAGLRESWEFPGGALVVGLEKDPGLGGWIPVPEGRMPEAGGVDPAMVRVDPEKVTLVLALPGYEAARLPLPEVRGRREVRVNPEEPDARGVVTEPKDLLLKNLGGAVEVAQNTFIPDPGVSIGSVKIHSLDSPPQKVPEDLLGLPSRFGPFSLYGLPDGAWEIEVTAQFNDGPVIRGKKSFERRGGTVEIGTIELKEGGVLRVKVVDSAEKPMPQAFVVAVRPDEDPDQGRPFNPDGEGRVVVADLEPGVDHRVQVRGLPRLLEQSVRAAPASEVKDTEFRWPEKAVPCRITLLVDGKAVANPDGSRTIPASVHESPLPRDRGSWGADGTFEAPLVPGTYRFSAYATPKEGSGLALFAGEVTVPAGESFEARLELRREP